MQLLNNGNQSEYVFKKIAQSSPPGNNAIPVNKATKLFIRFYTSDPTAFFDHSTFSKAIHSSI